MRITFPEGFAFGTSTSAYQIETAREHDWLNLKSRDGNIFQRTTDHELRYKEDVEIIHSLSPNYRMSLMWSKLQHHPFGQLNNQAANEYEDFLQALTQREVKIMMVIHHFANPLWFANAGGWANDKNIDVWVNYGKQVVDRFGPYVESWNTFNEPNLYASMAYVAGEFPPRRTNPMLAYKALTNISRAHAIMYEHIKSAYPDKMVGISHNCAIFKGENIIGEILSKIVDWFYMNFAERLFDKKDFVGLSYYARIGLDPSPITYVNSPGKLEQASKEHDDIWEYYPKGLEECILRFWKKYQKPIIITENGICTEDDNKRIRAIEDYMSALSAAMAQGADVRGYYHWCTWDNFEWTLGPSFKFGLYACDPITKERTRKPSADLYSRLAYTKQLVVSSPRTLGNA